MSHLLQQCCNAKTPRSSTNGQKFWPSISVQYHPTKEIAMTIQDKLPRFLVKPYAFVYGVLDTIVRSPFTAIEKGFEASALAQPEPAPSGRPGDGRHYVKVTGKPDATHMITGTIYMTPDTYERASREMGIKNGDTLDLEQTREFMVRYGDAEAVKAWDAALKPGATEEYDSVIASGGSAPTRVVRRPYSGPSGNPNIFTTAKGNQWIRVPEGLQNQPYLIIEDDPEMRTPVPAWLLAKLGYEPGQSISKTEAVAVSLAVLEARAQFTSDDDFAENRNRRLAA
jgi:hypothetical protein